MKFIKKVFIANVQVLMITACLTLNGVEKANKMETFNQCTVNAAKTTVNCGKPTSFHVGSLFLSLGHRMNVLLRSNLDQSIKLRGELGINIPPEYGKPSFCRDSKHCLSWGGSDVKLMIKRPNSKCHIFVWKSLRKVSDHLVDCFSYGMDNWYGGPENANQFWPVEDLELYNQPYLPKESQFMAITERYWLNSRGVYIYVDEDVPLFVDSNNYRQNSIDSNNFRQNSICFIAKDSPPYLPRDNIRLKYTVCQFEDARKAHEHALKNVLKTPTGLPDLKMVRHPIWSTWVRFQENVNQSATLDFAKSIVEHGFNNSQLEIDDNWETCYGSTRFNTAQFPDAKNMTDSLKAMGFRVTLWTHPFVNINCEDHRSFLRKGYFVKNHKGYTKTFWWNGEASVVDFTASNAVAWFREKHYRLLNETGIDGFKFDAGETSWLPQVAILNATHAQQPQVYTSAFVDAVSTFGKISEVRVGQMTQDYPIFVRMLDKDSRWTYENGLPTLITTLLVMNMAGYYWVLPDMVGGNGYDTPISKELFIRWLQANTFMPSVQFSAAPFDYDNETIEISKKFTGLHYEYSERIIGLMNHSIKTGAPLNPPVWWIDPKNPTTYAINSQYLLGEDVLVAPVIEEGATHRDVYLPKGLWRDENNPSKLYKGRNWLRNYPANLSTLPYFTRVRCSHHTINETDISNGIHQDEETFF